MRMLGIDYGTKRVGLAISDEAAQFALPLAVIANSADLAGKIQELATEHGVTTVVMGESRKHDMTANAILPDVLALKKKLEDAGLRVQLELEFMTSQQAERLQGKHDKIDASAAALILQSWLDRGPNGSGRNEAAS